MADADFTLKLVDMLTGPARRAAASANALVERLKASEAAAKEAGKAGQHMQKLEAATNKAATAAERLAVAEAHAGQVTAAAANKAAMAKEHLAAASAKASAAAKAQVNADIKAAFAQKSKLEADLKAAFALKDKNLKAAQDQWYAERRAAFALKDKNLKAARDQWYAERRMAKARGQDILRNQRAAMQSTASKRWGQGVASRQGFAAQQAASPIRQAAAGGGMGSMMASFGGNIMASALAKVASVVASIVGALAHGAVTLGQWVIGAAMFADRQKMALGILLKSSAAGSAAYKEAIGLAGKYGLAVQDTATAYTKLIKQGFTTSQAKDLVTMAADLKAVGASAEETQRVLDGIAKIKAAGTLQGDELNILAEAGVNIELVYKSLAKSLGKSVAEVRKLKEAGKITSDQAIAAIKEATLQTMGTSKLGEAADKMGKTLGGSWDRFKSKAETVLLTIGERLVPRMVDKVVPMLDKLMSWADSPAGAKFVDDIVHGFGGLVDMLGDIEVSDVTDTIEGIGAAFRDVKSAVGAVIVGFRALGYIPGIASMIAAFKLLLSIVQAVGKAIEWMKGGEGNATEAGGLDSGTMPDIIDEAGMAATMSTAGKTVGASLVQGIIDGIMGGLGSIAQAASAAAGAAVTASQSALDAHSPSRVFRDLYASVPAGAVEGITDGSPRVQSAAANMISSAGVGGSRTTSSSVRTHAPVNITIPAAADPQTTAALVAATLKTQVVGLFQEAALQVNVLGAAA